jgi:hypothetical protein
MKVGEHGADLTIRVASLLDAPPQAVWERIITEAGINDEMRPILRMRFPRALRGLDPETVELGVPLGRCWLLLFGVVPFDYDELTLVRLDPGRGFLERSRMLSQRLWEHERTLEPSGEGGCLVTDRVRWRPRRGVPGAALRPVIGAFFRHRHDRLRQRFGGRPAA